MGSIEGERMSEHTDRCILSLIFPCINIRTLAAVACTPMLGDSTAAKMRNDQAVA
jgi:hypothetical protein